MPGPRWDAEPLLQKLVKGGGRLKDVKRKLFMQEFTSHFTVKSAGQQHVTPTSSCFHILTLAAAHFTFSCYRITHVGPNLMLFDSFSSIFGPL